MNIRGMYRFRSLVKQNKKAKICFVIHIAGERKLFFYIYAVIVKQKKKALIITTPLATPTMQTVQDSWMGLVTRRALGGVVLFLVNRPPAASRNLARRSSIQADTVACTRDHLQQFNDNDVFYLFLQKQKRGAELHIYLEQGTYHKRLFRGPNTNDMKK